MKIRAAALALLLAAWSSRPVVAQTSRSDPTDLQSWLGAGIDLDLPRKWKGSVDYQLRLVGDAGTYRGSYLTGEIGRPLVKGLDLFASYRVSILDDGTFHRFAGGAEGTRDFGRLKLSLRQSVQMQRQAAPDDDENASSDKVLARTRLRGKAKLAKWLDAYASTEPYFRFGADYPVDNWRNTVGLELDAGPNRGVDLFYIYRPDYAKSYNRTFHVIGVKLSVDVKAP